MYHRHSPMRDLNYLHLHHFWVVAREGSIAGASKCLELSQPTISGQIQELEQALGHELFSHVGRGLELTDTGQVVYRFADRIFSLGHEMLDALNSEPSSRLVRLRVGITASMPPILASRILAPAHSLRVRVNIAVHEKTPDRLFAELSAREIDLVLCDVGTVPAGVKAHKHLLGECGTSFFAAIKNAAELRKRFPRSLHGAARIMLPDGSSAVRREIDRWLESQRIRPEVVCEFEQASLIALCSQPATGIFPAPTVIEKDVQRHYGAGVIGRVPQLQQRFYAISAERTVRNPVILSMIASARKLFG